jgi:hypothetical protein
MKTIGKIALLAAVFWGGLTLGARGIAQEAARHHAGRFIVNQSTGETVFRWNDESVNY